MKMYQKSEKFTPIVVFNDPSLKKRINELCITFGQDIKKRYDEIFDFVDLKDKKELSYDNILFLFKNCFYKDILDESIKNSRNQNDMRTTFNSLINSQKVQSAINGRTFVDAFIMAIRSIENHDLLDPCIHGGKIMLLKQKYLGVDIKRWYVH